MEIVQCIRIIKNGESVLAPFEKLEMVVMEPDVIPVPDAPEEILGVGWYEDQLIPYMRLKEDNIPTPIRCGIFLHTEQGRLIGIAADTVGETVEAEREAVEAQEDFMKILAGGS